MASTTDITRSTRISAGYVAQRETCSATLVLSLLTDGSRCLLLQWAIVLIVLSGLVLLCAVVLTALLLILRRRRAKAAAAANVSGAPAGGANYVAPPPFAPMGPYTSMPVEMAPMGGYPSQLPQYMLMPVAPNGYAAPGDQQLYFSAQPLNSV